MKFLVAWFRQSKPIFSQTSLRTMSAGSTEKATFGLGCFWESDGEFGILRGVVRTVVGYSGGTPINPTYKNLGDHTEVIQVEFNPAEITYSDLLKTFWRAHDPTTLFKTQYQSVIYYNNGQQKLLAEQTKQTAQNDHQSPIVTKILPLGTFYDAEDYHQKYYLRNSPLFPLLNLTGAAFIQSPLAAKLNGYCGGYAHGNVAKFEEDAKTWNLEEKVLELARQIAATAKPLACG